MIEEKETSLTIDYEMTFKNFRDGQIVKGRVLQVTPKEVIVDIGYKSEGLIPIDEFSNAAELKVGDELDVYLEEMEDENGRCVLSRRKAEKSHGWEKAVASMREGEVTQGRVVRKVKGGLMLDIGVEAFL